MQNIDTDPWKHSHAFGQQVKKKGESRTIWVVIINLVTMVVEIVAGILSGSMALLADGLHMASHAAALTINVFAYRYARKNAFNKSFSYWRNCQVLWIQSVFVKKEFRGMGVFKMLYENIKSKVLDKKNGYCGLRLYVDKTNKSAQSVYKKLGMENHHYETFEWMLK
jgi:GNAT superfamily N-acetyltransferase